MLSIKNKNLNTFKLISQIHIKKNDFKNAKLFLTKILNLDKTNLFALNSLGDLNKSEKNYEEAEKFYIKSISCDENFASAYFLKDPCLSKWSGFKLSIIEYLELKYLL